MELDLENTTYRFIDAGLRNLTRFDLRHHIVEQRQPILGHHNHVDACVDRLNTVVGLTPGNLSNAVPITDDKTVESQLVAKHGGQQFVVAMDLVPVPAIE